MNVVLLVLLLLANAGYWAWTQGWIKGFGPPHALREPQRLNTQMEPERLVLLNPDGTPKPLVAPAPAVEPAAPAPEATAAAPVAPPAPSVGDPAGGADSAAVTAAAPTAAPVVTPTPAPPVTPPAPPPPVAPPVPPTSAAATPDAAVVAASNVPAPAKPNEPTRCWLISGLTDKQLAALKPSVSEALPAVSWTVTQAVLPARWIVYSGRFPSTELMADRKAELRELKVPFRDVTAPNLQPGLSFGTYSTEEAAQQAQKDVTRAGVKGTKVAVERPETTLYALRVPQANAALEKAFKTAASKAPKDLLVGKVPQLCNDTAPPTPATRRPAE